jgi:hypothetical protein
MPGTDRISLIDTKIGVRSSEEPTEFKEEDGEKWNV